MEVAREMEAAFIREQKDEELRLANVKSANAQQASLTYNHAPSAQIYQGSTITSPPVDRSYGTPSTSTTNAAITQQPPPHLYGAGFPQQVTILTSCEASHQALHSQKDSPAQPYNMSMHNFPNKSSYDATGNSNIAAPPLQSYAQYTTGNGSLEYSQSQQIYNSYYSGQPQPTGIAQSYGLIQSGSQSLYGQSQQVPIKDHYNVHQAQQQTSPLLYSDASKVKSQKDAFSYSNALSPGLGAYQPTGQTPGSNSAQTLNLSVPSGQMQHSYTQGHSSHAPAGFGPGSYSQGSSSYSQEPVSQGQVGVQQPRVPYPPMPANSAAGYPPSIYGQLSRQTSSLSEQSLLTVPQSPYALQTGAPVSSPYVSGASLNGDAYANARSNIPAPMDESKIRRLMEMGFARDACVEALARCNQDENATINILLSTSVLSSSGVSHPQQSTQPAVTTSSSSSGFFGKFFGKK